MTCPACGHDNPEHAKFCGECGQGLALRCSSCDAELVAGSKFCNQCGATISALTTTSAPPTQIPERKPSAYTPQHLAEKILTSRSAIEGERKQVTVLFADVKGSMELADQLDAEQWHHVLDRFFSILTDAIHRYEGTVNQYTGDGIMALFGAPIAHEDHARRACYASLDARAKLTAYADQLRIEQGLNFGVRIGLNSGDVVVGKIGDDLRMDYTAQGHTVGLAQRIEQLAAADRVYMSEHTKILVDGYFELRDLGTSKLRGAKQPVGIFELEGLGAARTRLDLSRVRGLTRFVGRNDEMNILTTALSRARNGHGQVVGVVGEAGLGKSRLCHEFVEQCRAQGIAIFEGHCPAHGKNIPYLPILELYRSFFGITTPDSPAQARNKIAGALLLLDKRLVDSLAVLFEFMGVSDPDKPAPDLPADTRQRQLFELTHKVYRAQTEQGIETIAFIDDVHWIDPGSDAFLTQLVEATAASNTLLLLNFRPEYQAEWTNRTFYQQLPLVPLGADDLRELLVSLLGTDRSISALVPRVIDWTGGNPFFTEEIVQMLIESGHLEGTPGAYRLMTPLDELDVPVNVRSVLAARIDRLSENAKRLLQTASVIGKEFSGPLLTSVAELNAADISSALDRLRNGDFIFDRALYPVAEYAFKHPLTQEVAYDSQLEVRRSEIHAAVARALEHGDDAALDKQASLLAYHWDSAGDLPKALEWHERAAVFTGGHDAPASMRHWLRVRELVAALPPDEATLSTGAVACSRILMLGWRLQSTEAESQRYFEDGKRMAEQAGDKALMARLYLGYAILTGVGLAYADDYLKYTALAADIADELNDHETQCGVEVFLPWAHLANGNLNEAREAAAAVSEKLPEDLRYGATVSGMPPRALVTLAEGMCLSLGGELSQALIAYQQGRAQMESSGFVDGMVYADFMSCMAAAYAGNIPLVHDFAQSVLEIAADSSSGVIPIAAEVCAGVSALLMQDLDTAIKRLERARTMSIDNRGGGLIRVPEGHFLIDALLKNGEPEKALEHGEELFTYYREHNFRMTVMPWIAVARVHIQTNDRAAALGLGLVTKQADRLRCRLRYRRWLTMMDRVCSSIHHGMDRA